MLPLILEDGVSYQQPASHLMKVMIEVEKGTQSFSNCWMYLTEEESYTANRVSDMKKTFNTQKYLSPRSISQKLKEIMKHFFTDENVIESLKSDGIFLNFARSEHFYKFGPAIDVLVSYQSPQGLGSFVVDVVPFLHIASVGQHVINPYYSDFVFMSGGKAPNYIEEGFHDPTIYWRKSHSNLEHKLFQHFKEKLRIPLMIWKTLALKNSFFNKAPIVNSFHLKNVVLLLAFDRLETLSKEWVNDTGSVNFDDFVDKWLFYPLPLQVKEVGKRLYNFFRAGTMPWAFHKNIHVKFKPKNKEICKDYNLNSMRSILADYLEDIIKSDDWCKLIHDSEITVNMNECPYSRVKGPTKCKLICKN
uniref:Uncharacterized protein n=2 Tax=Clytia hemisphaerica TaxID=252671 RepID=A0A7M5VFL5_9CNID